MEADPAFERALLRADEAAGNTEAATMQRERTHERSAECLEIHECCLRKTKGDQQWVAYAEYQGRVGPIVQSYSRKNVRTKARTAFGHPTHEGSRMETATKIAREVTITEEQMYAVARVASRLRNAEEKRLLKEVVDFWHNNEATEMELA